jgi:hypothetical protein
MTIDSGSKRIFTYEAARELMPRVIEITREAVERVDQLLADSPSLATDDVPDDVLERYNEIVDQWAGAILDLGVDVKGLWLVDFDNGSGYYCWKYPEPSLQYFHGYDEGFKGRVKLN